MNMKLTSTI